MTLQHFLFLAMVSSKHYIVETNDDGTKDDGTKHFTNKKGEDYLCSPVDILMRALTGNKKYC